MSGEAIRTISFAGAGNVAFNLAPALFKAGYEIRCIHGRNPENTGQLAAMVNAKPVFNVDEIDGETDLLILALPDQVIPGFSLSVKNAGRFSGIMVHTSGSQSLGAITQYHANGGVFYPLQSFTKVTRPDISGIPICIEGATAETEAVLMELAGKLSGDVRRVDTSQRALIHLAAVFASNFTNYMYSVADCLLSKTEVKPDILLPLIHETALRINGGDAATLQTGPAVRRDWSTIDMHLSMLRNNPEIREVYKTISELIVKLKETGGAC
ncbi:MAG: DUF2520 domain-containing protein [Bacteroidales bacterium]|nr:DUF2520 domain-containing protein [Bacteroidales bacterium]MBK9359300.1 DUF2520 domain-containing protein [Bacteroidales bacterium]